MSAIQVCEMRVCEQQQMEEVRAALSVAGEPSPYSTDSLLLAETLSISSGASSPTPDQPSTHNDRMKLMRKMLKKKFAQPYSRVSPSKVGGRMTFSLSSSMVWGLRVYRKVFGHRY